MKLSASSLIAATTLSLVMASSAFAMVPTNQSVSADVSDAVGHGRIQVTVQDGVATLFGDVQDGIEEGRALSAARNSEGVTGVINLITSN